MKLDRLPCYATVEFCDFVKDRKKGTFVTEVFPCSGVILFTCAPDLVNVFSFDNLICLFVYKRTFFTYKVEHDRTVMKKCHKCHRRSLAASLCNFSFFEDESEMKLLHVLTCTLLKLDLFSLAPMQ